jgi:hypothetical protein
MENYTSYVPKPSTTDYTPNCGIKGMKIEGFRD